MQQYFDIDSGSGTLTVFHTEDSVGFDVEHYGGFKIDASELKNFLESETEEFVVTENPAEQHPTLAETRPSLYPDEENFRGTMTRKDSGLEIYIEGERNEVTVTLTAEQVETLTESITVGEVDRYEDGKYPVESVGRDGVRHRAEHKE